MTAPPGSPNLAVRPVAVITGGSTGIGKRLVEAFATAGFDVVFTYKEKSADPAFDAPAGARIRGFPCDAGDAEEVSAFYAQLEGEFGAPDVLVNNAGIQTWSSLLDLSHADWERVIRTNLTGCFLNTQAAAKLMIAAKKSGAIVNIGSGCNKLAFPNLVDYTASKGGVEQFTKVAAVELGPHGIRVNCVAPGAITTERTEAEADDYAKTWSAITPLRRVGTPADVASAVLFLASDSASFITGQTIWVDGGVFTQANWPYR